MSWVQPRVLDLAQVSGASYAFPEVPCLGCSPEYWTWRRLVHGASCTFHEVSQEVTMSWVQPRVLDLAKVSGASYTFPEVSQEVTMSWVQPGVLGLVVHLIHSLK